MPDPYRILSSPIRLTGRLPLAHLCALVSTDALQRRARAEGRDVQWIAGTLAGDLAGQNQAERELARQGLDRATLGRHAFVGEVRRIEAEARTRLRPVLDVLGVDVDVEAGAIDRPAAARAARTAFVRLYEAGLLERDERVVDVCPRCATVVAPADADPAAVETDALTLRFSLPGNRDVVLVDVVAPELLPGVVAVAVPPGHDAIGAAVEVPLTGRVVPVVEDERWQQAGVVVPAHDERSAQLSRALGLGVLPVLDGDGVVTAAGPLAELGRYAARAAVTELLVTEGLVVRASRVLEPSARCRRCGTVLVPRLGRHWFLAMDDLAVAAADAVREGSLSFSPPAALDTFLTRAGASGDWCLSHQVWAGQRVPVAWCRECGGVSVAVDGPSSCGKCMGELEDDDGVLDARFVGAVWPLACAGWPDDERGVAAARTSTTLVVSATGVGRWAVPMAALALRLVGSLPFARVAVHDVAVTPDDPDPRVPEDFERLLGVESRRVLRAALVRGGLDLDTARTFVGAVDDPPEGDADIEALAEGCAAAFAAGSPGLALNLLSTALSQGIRASAADRVRAMAAPILGD